MTQIFCTYFVPNKQGGGGGVIDRVLDTMTVSTVGGCLKKLLKTVSTLIEKQLVPALK